MKIIPRWLVGGADRELAATEYADRESATDRAKRIDARAHHDRMVRRHRNLHDAPDPFDRNGFLRNRRSVR